MNSLTLRNLSFILAFIIMFLINAILSSQVDSTDTDNDGIPDWRENEIGTDPTNDDSDGDGIKDGEEVLSGLNPKSIDTDGDGLSDKMEYKINTNPLIIDTDGDGLSDGNEYLYGLDPLKKDTNGDGINDKEEIEDEDIFMDTDGDSLPDKRESDFKTNPKKIDTDDDGLPDGKEVLIGTDPTNPDTDGDGITDGVELLNQSNPLRNTKENQDIVNEERDENSELERIKVRLFLQNGQVIKGTTELEEKGFMVTNKVGDINYEKELNIDEIDSIEILEWIPQMTSKTSDSKNNEIEYTFFPSKYKLKLKDGKVYYQKARYENIDVLLIENEYGKTKVFSIFVDYWIKESSKKGYWFNSGISEFSGNNRNPHPMTVVKIEIKKSIDD